MSKCYHLFRKKAKKILSIEQLAEMDKKLMEEYALNKAETIHLVFSGLMYSQSKLKMDLNTWDGIIYFTLSRPI